MGSLAVGGGIWRIKQQLHSDTLLIAAMHAGFLVLEPADLTATAASVETDNGGLHTTVAARYTEQSSLAYGADWLVDGASSSSSRLAATCSFYDHTMRIWSY